MTAHRWYVGLDIGSSTVAVATATHDAAGQVALAGCEVLPSAGVVRGEVVDAAALEQVLAAALRRVAERTGAPVERVALSVSGLHLRRVTAAAEQRTPRAVRVEADMLEALHRRALRDPRVAGVVLASVPRGCTVDGFPVVDPLAGLYGHVVRVKMEAYSIPTSYVDTRARILARLGAEVDLLMPRAMAAAEAALPASVREQGALLIDLGGTTTDVAVYLDGQIRELFSMPIGVRSVATLGRGVTPVASGARGYPAPRTVPGGGMVDLFHRIRQRLDDLDLGWRLAGGAVLAGGGAGIDGVLGAAQRGLRIPVRLARPGGPRFSDTRTTGAVGLVLAQARLRPLEPAPEGVFGMDETLPDEFEEVEPEPPRPGLWPALGRWLREFVPLGGTD